jgi:hypothetical protein
MGNVIQLKRALDEIVVTHEDLLNLRTVKPSKTMQRHLDRIKAGKFEKSEINALTKLIQSSRFAEQIRKNEILAFLDLVSDEVGFEYLHGGFQGAVRHFKKPMKITKQQTELGKQWLRNYFFKLNGKKRTGKATEFVGDRVLQISKKVKRFEFVGILIGRNQWRDISGVLPIYRTYDSSGNYFDYAPIHWGQPIIMENY